MPTVGKPLAAPLAWSTGLPVCVVHWFGHFPRWSYRIPGLPLWLIVAFFVFGVALAAAMRIVQKRWSVLLRARLGATNIRFNASESTRSKTEPQ